MPTSPSPPPHHDRLSRIAGRIAFKSTLLSLLRDRSVRAASASFALTRFIVFALFVLTPQVIIDRSISPPGAYATTISLHKAPVALTLRERASIADCWWYASIVQAGYDRRPFAIDKPYNWAFFPLFPLVLRMVSRITGEIPLTGMVLSAIFFFVALVLLHKLVGEFGLDETDADRTIFYLAAFPVSYFFSIPMTESLFLLLTVGSFYAAKREYWWWAGILGALASATRFTGVLLLPALAVLYWQRHGRVWPPRKEFLSLLLIPTGLLSFMIFLYFITGNPFAFKDIQVVWGRRTTFFLVPLFGYMRDPLLLASPWNFKIIDFLAATMALVCGLVLLKWRWWSLATYTLISIISTLTSGLLQSHARYAMVMFPIFMTLAVAGRRPRIDRLIRAVFLVLLTLITLMFCLHLDIGLS